MLSQSNAATKAITIYCRTNIEDGPGTLIRRSVNEWVFLANKINPRCIWLHELPLCQHDGPYTGAQPTDNLVEVIIDEVMITQFEQEPGGLFRAWTVPIEILNTHGLIRVVANDEIPDPHGKVYRCLLCGTNGTLQEVLQRYGRITDYFRRHDWEVDAEELRRDATVYLSLPGSLSDEQIATIIADCPSHYGSGSGVRIGGVSFQRPSKATTNQIATNWLAVYRQNGLTPQ